MKGKGNDGTGDNVERDLWETKQEIFDKINNQYHFHFDCCASKKNSKCIDFSDDFEKEKEISLMSWMNPPFSNAYNMFRHFFKVVKNGIAIYRCDNMETKVWQNVILQNATWVFIPKGRVSYKTFEVGNMRNGNGTRFPSALIGLNVEPIKNIQGTTLFLKQKGEELI